MKLRNIILTGAAFLMAAPMFASTYFGGFEDTVKGDYDYNDLVFSLSGDGLKLNSAGKFYGKPDLTAQNGNPFWNNTSLDGQKYNIGFCIYGGGNCNGGKALDPQGSFLADANSTKVSANDVTFSIGSGKGVGATVYLSIAAANDKLGWYSLSSPSNINIIDPSKVTGVYSFNPNGDFGLVGISGNTNYYSQITLGNNGDTTSHLAFFATPEPGSMGLIAGGLVAVGSILRRRKQA